MRIVVVTTLPPLPFGNAASRWSYVLLKELVQRGHRVTCISSARTRADVEGLKDWLPEPDYDVRVFMARSHSTKAQKIGGLWRPYNYTFSEQLTHELDRVLREPYDALHLEQLWSGWAGWKYRRRALLHVHYLPSLELAQKKPRSIKEYSLLRATEFAQKRVLNHFPHISAVSSELCAEIRKCAPLSNPTVLPFGIDSSLYHYTRQETTSTQPTLGLIGSFNWHPTYAAAVRLLTRLWPHILAQVPHARLLLVGRAAKSQLRAFANTPGLELLENVADIQPHFQRLHALAYAPESGSGIKIKVLEALCLGVPVLTTPVGVEGFPRDLHNPVLLAHNDADLVAGAVRLLTSPKERATLRELGRAFVSEQFGPEISVNGLLARLSEVSQARYENSALAQWQPVWRH